MKLSTSLKSVSTLIISTLLLCSSFFLSGCSALVVGGAAATASVVVDKRTAGDMVEDKSIKIKFNHELYSNHDLDKDTHINMISYNGWILLTGEVDSEETKDLVNNIALNIKNVKRVFNELEIRKPSSLQSRANDAYLASKIQLKLLALLPDYFYHTTIVVENKTVYLMGLLTTKESDSVINIVKNINGINKIVKLFDYQ